MFAFLSALLCIRWLIRYVSTHDFTVFAWYRIAFGGVVLLTAYGGWASLEPRMIEERSALALDRALAVASAVVIAWGVLALGWSPFVVMMLFWFENVVIGVLNVAKILVTGVRLGMAGVIGGIAMSAFFTVHYGLFTAVHGMFVVLLFGGAEARPRRDGRRAGRGARRRCWTTCSRSATAGWRRWRSSSCT